jgi:hypothetical protein
MSIKTNYWRVYHIDLPEGHCCPIGNGYAVGWADPYPVKMAGYSNYTAFGIIIIGRYSEFELPKHALSQCNTLNMQGVHKNRCELGDLYVINQEHVYDVY